MFSTNIVVFFDEDHVYKSNTKTYPRVKTLNHQKRQYENLNGDVDVFDKFGEYLILLQYQCRTTEARHLVKKESVVSLYADKLLKISERVNFYKYPTIEEGWNQNRAELDQVSHFLDQVRQLSSISWYLEYSKELSEQLSSCKTSKIERPIKIVGSLSHALISQIDKLRKEAKLPSFINKYFYYERDENLILRENISRDDLYEELQRLIKMSQDCIIRYKKDYQEFHMQFLQCCNLIENHMHLDKQMNISTCQKIQLTVADLMKLQYQCNKNYEGLCEVEKHISDFLDLSCLITQMFVKQNQ